MQRFKFINNCCNGFFVALVVAMALATTVGCSEKAGPTSNVAAVSQKPTIDLTPEQKYAELVKKAEVGDSSSQFNLAEMYQSGKGSTKDMAKATEWYEKAAVQGHRDAQSKLSLIYARREGAPKDVAMVVDWTQIAAEQGNASAQFALSALYAKGIGVTKDLTKAIALIEKAEAQGYAEAQFVMGSEVYKKGIPGVVPKDLLKSVELIQKAVNQGLEDAQKELARMYLKGDGVPKDAVRSLELWEKVADRGDLETQKYLATIYEKGDGIPQNAIKAFQWWQRAAEQGDAAAEYSMGRLYRIGRGVPTDAMKAFEWTKKAAIKGYASAQGGMSFAYNKGEVVARDDVIAYAWESLAQSQDASGSLQMKNFGFVQSMTPTQIAEGQRLSSAWKKGQDIAREEQSRGTGDGTPSFGKPVKQGAATAFFVSKTGQAITNYHAIDGCKEVRIPGREGVVNVTTSDSVNDLALLQVSGAISGTAVINPDQSKTRQGDDIVVFGFPLTSVLSSGGNLTPGIISALTGLGNNTNQLQITAPIQPGSSGSPVMNKNGEVIGVVSMKLSDSKMAKATGSVGQNINFAVNGQTLKSFLDAHKVQYSTGGLISLSKSTADIADDARKWTTVVECWK